MNNKKFVFIFFFEDKVKEEFNISKNKNYDKEFWEMISNQKSVYQFNNEFNDEQFKKTQKYLIEYIIILTYKIYINKKKYRRVKSKYRN